MQDLQMHRCPAAAWPQANPGAFAHTRHAQSGRPGTGGCHSRADEWQCRTGTSSSDPGNNSPFSALFSFSKPAWLNTREELRQRLLLARDKLQQHIAALQAIADAVDEVHRGATIANITGGAVGIAGGITTVVGLCLAPVTFGASLIVSLTGLGVSLAGGLTSAAATTTDIVKSKVKKGEVQKILQQCQEELGLIQDYMKTNGNREQELCEDLRLLFTVWGGTGRAANNTAQIVRASALLAGAGRVARFAGAALHTMTTVTLALDIFFTVKDAVELHRGARTELAAKIREAIAGLTQTMDELDKVQELLAARSGTPGAAGL
ncbi:PREDICTED: apolipoprotein L3-like [Gavialis gangeticus]|uniref:apolipoprotein L3-like n=1 Tax=Gavialis gangeticus TaxID=94835 RepID=UPI00092EBD8F|nr:PREDICTED: apolipoprotein L3-like [Gavialis gangeticus]